MLTPFGPKDPTFKAFWAILRLRQLYENIPEALDYNPKP